MGGERVVPDSCAGEAVPGGAFREALRRHGLSLRRGAASTLQVNTGLACDLSCRHCHLEAGPGRREAMGRETMEEVVRFARRFPFAVIDVTGGAPELVPGIGRLLSSLAPLAPRLLVRTNLTALLLPGGEDLVELYRRTGAEVVASLPAPEAGRTAAQRGEGTWERCLASLRRLNAAGFGVPGSGLVLDLVSNPAGAFLPPGQGALEERFRRALSRHGVAFSRLHAFANAPLGRFREWLERSGNAEGYLRMLAERFNPRAVEGLMCRTLLSVDWEGRLWDCDFHLAAGVPFGGGAGRISDLDALPPEGTEIPVADHCLACTAGAGFT